MANVDRNELCLDKPIIYLINDNNTSGKYHLEPFLVPTAILSLVETCWTANGLTEAIALLKESNFNIIFYQHME